MKQYTYKGRIYSVVKCVKEDIPSHIERVYSYWTDDKVDIEEQTSLLLNCINNGRAIKLIDSTNRTQAVIYFLQVKDGEITSHLLWTRSKKLFAILAYYLRTHLNVAKVFFMPHSKTFIPFEFMVTPQSIRRFHSHNMPLIIDLFSANNRELGYALIRDGIVEEL